MKLYGSIAIFLALGLCICSKSWGADWKAISLKNTGTDYYDAESITHPFMNVVRVWVKSDFTEKGV